MKMVGHQDVMTNQPSVGLAPDIFQSTLNLYRREPRFSILGADGQVDDRRLVRRSEYTMHGALSTRFIIWSVTRGHGYSNTTRRRKSQGRRHAVPPIESVCSGGTACCGP